MNVCRPVLAAAIIAALCPAVVRAQSYSEPFAPVVQAADVVRASATSGDGQPSCNACNSCCNSCCDSCCNDCCCGSWFDWPCGCCLSDLGEACKLWKPCCEDSPYSAGGWIAQSFVWNPYNPRDRFNGPVTWLDRSNEYQLNEVYFYVAKATKTDCCCPWDWGYRMDVMYGTNYRWNTSGGFETDWDTNRAFYGFAMPQLYGELAYNDLTLKVGRFFSPVGYYVIGTANNFFPVLPYTFQYGEPFTHTGVLASYKYSDSLTYGGALTHGWDNTDNRGNPHLGGLANATYTIDECRSLAYVGVFGQEPNLSGVSGGFTTRYLQTMVYTRKLSDDAMWVLQSDFGTQSDAVLPGVTAKWYGLNTYLYWNMTCRCQWGVNGEWFRDQGGFRVGQVLPSIGSPNARGFAEGGPGPQSPGYNGSFYRFTFGPKYFLTPNVYTRAAFLADYYSGARDADTGSVPFDDGTKRHQEVLAFDLIATY